MIPARQNWKGTPTSCTDCPAENPTESNSKKTPQFRGGGQAAEGRTLFDEIRHQSVNLSSKRTAEDVRGYSYPTKDEVKKSRKNPEGELAGEST